MAVSVLVSVCSVTATAWVVVRTVAVAIDKERGQAHNNDARVYGSLLGYAATHANWEGAGPLVEELADDTDQRIVLTDMNGRTVRDSATAPGQDLGPSERPMAVVDPLNVDPQLRPDATTDTIDARASGPFRLSASERRQLQKAATEIADCFRRVMGMQATVRSGPQGRPRVVTADPDFTTSPRCNSASLGAPVPSEKKALTALNDLVNTCLSQHDTAPVLLEFNLNWQPADETQATNSTQVERCLSSSRSQQLAPYVAPAVHLYASGHERTPTTFFDLSGSNKNRIAGAAALVLVATVAVTTLAGTRLIRPLRALTTAAGRMEEGAPAPPVVVTGRDEIAQLSRAFNSMAARREELELLRKNMTSDIAHELRTPLSNIRGWLEAVADGIAEPDTDLVSALLTQAFVLQHIIDDLQDLAAADAGELRLSRQLIDVPDLLTTSATAHQANAQEAGVTVEVVTAADSGVPMVLEADPVRLRQIVGNLLANAIRHTSEGGSVTLRARREDDDVVIDVADTGSGIAPDDVPRLFDRFWRADKSRSRLGGGSGLGLAIVRKLTEAHGGTATATSSLGEGSVFTLRLPAPHPTAVSHAPGSVPQGGLGSL
ncbi:ATP-binding protein [Streptomyces sp. NPDC055210]